jgi:hypothetical protein
MASRDEQDLLAVAAFGKVETPGVRRGLGSDGEPERRKKRTVNVDSWV